MTITWLLITVAVAAVAVILTARRIKRREKAALELLLEAIENGDTSVRFRSRSADDVNAILNRINRMLADTRRKAAERERYHELIVDSADSGILVTDTNGCVIRHNPAAAKMLGLETITHINRLDDFSDSLTGIISGAAPGERHLVQGVSAGRRIRLSARVSEFMSGKKSLKIVSLTAIDSELDNCEIDSWRRLTRVMTHEIMNFTAPIKSLSNTLMSLAERDPEAVRDGLATINDASAELSRFVNSYRRLSTIPEPELSVSDIAPILAKAIAINSEHASQRRVAVECAVCESTLTAYCDRSMTIQILVNLIRNAVDATPAGRRVIVAARSESDGSVTVEVTNTGERIPEEIRAQIFVPFFTTKPDGSGIGLSLSRQLARAQGATLQLLPYPPGSDDTTFALTFH